MPRTDGTGVPFVVPSAILRNAFAAPAPAAADLAIVPIASDVL
jgi:hypothetical protein